MVAGGSGVPITVTAGEAVLLGPGVASCGMRAPEGRIGEGSATGWFGVLRRSESPPFELILESISDK